MSGIQGFVAELREAGINVQFIDMDALGAPAPMPGDDEIQAKLTTLVENVATMLADSCPCGRSASAHFHKAVDALALAAMLNPALFRRLLASVGL